MQAQPNKETQCGTHLLHASVRLRSGAVTEILVRDISTAGCMVELRAPNLQPDQRVLIKFMNLGYLPAYVQWIEDGKAGLQFERPLNEAVRNHMLGSNLG